MGEVGERECRVREKVKTKHRTREGTVGFGQQCVCCLRCSVPSAEEGCYSKSRRKKTDCQSPERSGSGLH